MSLLLQQTDDEVLSRVCLHCHLQTMTENLKLFVYVLGRGSPFPVSIQSSETVGDLKNAIFKKIPNDLKSVDPDRLSLWKASIADEDLEDRASSFIKESVERGEKPLRPTMKLHRFYDDAYWNSIPGDGIVHVLAQLPVNARESLQLTPSILN